MNFIPAPQQAQQPGVNGTVAATANPVLPSTSLLGNVPTSNAAAGAAAPFLTPGATLLPAVLAYPTTYLPPTSAPPQGPAGGRGSRMPQPTPLLCEFCSCLFCSLVQIAPQVREDAACTFLLLALGGLVFESRLD